MALRENRAANRFKYVTFFNVSKTEKQNYKANFKKKNNCFSKSSKKMSKKNQTFFERRRITREKSVTQFKKETVSIRKF